MHLNGMALTISEEVTLVDDDGAEDSLQTLGIIFHQLRKAVGRRFARAIAPLPPLLAILNVVFALERLDKSGGNSLRKDE